MNDYSEFHIAVLGIRFTVVWGAGVTGAHRQAMAAAWSRCLIAPRPWAGTEPKVPSLGMPFTAAIYFDSKKVDGGVKHVGHSTFEKLAESLTSEITVAAILEKAGEMTMLHACGIADPRDGSVIALVAKSGTGKTTASAVLGKVFGYVTDETVAIRHDGVVVPYPKPLSVKQTTAGSAKLQVGPDELSLKATPANLRIRSIVLLERVPNMERRIPVLQKVPLADAVLELVPDTSSQSAISEPLQSLCRLIDSVGGAWRVSYSEAADLAETLAPLFRGREEPRSPAPEKEWAAPEPVHAGGLIPRGWIRRAKSVDAVEIDGDLLVLFESEIVRLSGIAPAMWHAAAGSIPMQAMVEQIGARHGLPEGYQAALDAALDALVSRRVLERG